MTAFSVADITGETLWRVVMPSFVAGASTSAGRIIACAPILNRFLNQPIGNLQHWARENGGKVELVRRGWADP